MRNIIFITFLIFALSGCVSYDIDEILLQQEDISLTCKGEVQLAYDPSSCQMGYNASKNEFRVCSDNLADWFVITCASDPTEEGQTIVATAAWTGKTTTNTIKDLEFEVMKISEDGKIWMWCQSAKIGAVMQRL